jgi:hypothetical protein
MNRTRRLTVLHRSATSFHVAAPADVTLAAACEADVMQSPLIRAIFRTRELVLGSQPDKAERPRGIVAFTKSIGWGRLADVPGREIVMGAVTQPWNPDVVFRPLTAEAFATFNEPDYVKIVWTLRADPIGHGESVFRHETRVITTDSTARAKFRRYWAIFSPGIKLFAGCCCRKCERKPSDALLLRCDDFRLVRPEGRRRDVHYDARR